MVKGKLTNIQKCEHHLNLFRIAVNHEGTSSIKNIIANNSPAAENVENITTTNSTNAKTNTQENDSAMTTDEQVTSPAKICMCIFSCLIKNKQ